MNEDMLKQIIIDTIKGEEHLGENLKNQCVDYIEKLQNNWNTLKQKLEKTIKLIEKESLINFKKEKKMLSNSIK